MSTDAKQAKTVAEAVRLTAAGHPDEVWVKTRDGSTSFTWSEGVDQIDRIAGGMRNDRIPVCARQSRKDCDRFFHSAAS